MKRYRFRLEALLHFRERVEELLMREYVLLKSGLEKGERSLTSLVDLYERKADELTVHGELTPPELMAQSALIELLKEGIKVKEKELQIMRETVRLKREELTEASKARKVLDAVKERESRQYKKAGEKEEQAHLDEFALRCFKKMAW
ncbi:MAG: flagellar export protein FliJ [Deltaproteobacteria bacterium]|nr:flagellar export protein FliJ [Deltaproteobacteria bacterium]